MRTSPLLLLALCYTVHAIATPGHVLQKRFNVVNSPDVEEDGVRYLAGQYVPITDNTLAPGFWVEGPNNPICDLSCLDPAGSTAESCSKPGCDGGVSFSYSFFLLK